MKRTCSTPCNSVAFAALLAITTLFVPGRASADQAAAQALFDQAQALANSGDYEGACPKFAAAVELYPEGLGALGRLADCYEKIGKTASAWATWREVSVLADKSDEVERKEFADKRIEILEPKLAYLTIEVEGSIPGLEVSRGDQPVAEAMFGSAIAVDPGVINLKASAEGYEPWEGTVTVTEASRQTAKVPALKKIEVKEEAPRSDLTQGTSPYSPRNNGLFYGGIAAAGTGTVLVGVSVFLGLSAKSDYDGAFDDGLCMSNDSGPDTCTEEGQKITDDARSKATTGTILFASGAAVAVAGGVMIWLSGRDGGGESEQALTLAPQVSADDVGFAVMGRF